jgi:hypothetical protein
MQTQRLSWWRIAAAIPLSVVGLGSIVASNEGGGFTPPPVVANVSAAGIWRGALTSSVTQSAIAVTAVIAEAGTARFILDNGSQLVGSVTTDADQLTGSLTGITDLGLRWPDNTTVADFTIDGTVAARATITGTYGGGGDMGTLTLSFDSVYDRDSSLAALVGQWERLDALQNPTATFSFDAQGAIEGSDADGCIYSGTVTVPDPTVNVYAVALTVASCVASGVNINGRYDGTGVLTDETSGSSQSDVFILAANSNQYVITMRLSRI